MSLNKSSPVLVRYLHWSGQTCHKHCAV